VNDRPANYEAFEKSPIVTIDAASVRLVGTELQFDCELDDFAASRNCDRRFGFGPVASQVGATIKF
jgi:hypothetical protein